MLWCDRYSSTLKQNIRRVGSAALVGIVSFFLMASRPPAETLYTVRILDGASSLNVLTGPMTLQKRLLESRIRLSRFDIVQPALSTVIKHDLTVTILRNGARPSSLEFAEPGQKIIMSNRIPAGRRIKIHTGRVVLEPDRSENPSRSADIILMGEGRKTPRQKTFHLVATAYSPDVRDCWPYSEGVTAIGLRAGYGVAAIDPRVIPLGTRIYVEGYGYAIAADLGGAIRGRRIDLCFDTHDEAKIFGRKRVKVHLLD